MPYRANYPATVREVLDARITYKPAALAAVRRFAAERPWRGTLERRTELYRRLNAELAAAYAIREPELVFAVGDQIAPEARPVFVAGMAFSLFGGVAVSGSSSYTPAAHRITLRGSLSVVTYLHEFGHARGFDERQTCRWSINLFRRCFPRSFRRCRQSGHTLIAPSGHRS